MDKSLAHLVALYVVAYVAHLCQHLGIQLTNVLASLVKHMRGLNHIVAILVDVGIVVVFLHILAQRIIIVLAKLHGSVAREIQMAHGIHKECIGIEISDAALFHLQELVVGCKLAHLEQSLHRSNLVFYSLLELAPRLRIYIVGQAQHLNLIKIVDSLLVAALNAECIVKIVGIERDVHLVATLQIHVFRLFAIVNLSIQRILTIELYSSLTVNELKLVDTHVINQHHIGQHRILNVKLHRNSIGSLHLQSHKQKH